MGGNLYYVECTRYPPVVTERLGLLTRVEEAYETVYPINFGRIFADKSIVGCNTLLLSYETRYTFAGFDTLAVPSLPGCSQYMVECIAPRTP